MAGDRGPRNFRPRSDRSKRRSRGMPDMISLTIARVNDRFGSRAEGMEGGWRPRLAQEARIQQPSARKRICISKRELVRN